MAHSPHARTCTLRCARRRAKELVDIHLDDNSCSRVHAALVHHQDGRLFLIDLQSVRGLR